MSPAKRISFLLRSLLVTAALGYAVLMSLHHARPVQTDPLTNIELALLGFSPSDICGDAHEGANGTCPACLLQHVALLAHGTFIAAPLLAFSHTLEATQLALATQSRAPHAYHSRAPPLLLM